MVLGSSFEGSQSLACSHKLSSDGSADTGWSILDLVASGLWIPGREVFSWLLRLQESDEPLAARCVPSGLGDTLGALADAEDPRSSPSC